MHDLVACHFRALTGARGRRGGYRLAFVVSIKNDLEER
jgi:hypothetical protein